MTAYIAGLLLSLSLILAIGAQNAFVLRQGLRGEHVLAVVLACAISDALLIGAGVTGFGFVAARIPWLEPVMRYGGAAFLLVYALRSVWSAFRKTESLAPAEGPGAGLAATLAVCLTLTWANPHVYLDTVMLLGSISTQYAGQKLGFALGAMTGSFVFFFAGLWRKAVAAAVRQAGVMANSGWFDRHRHDGDWVEADPLRDRP